MNLQTILFPTDFSSSALMAFPMAVQLARYYKARLLVLHAVENSGPEKVTYGEAATRLLPESYRNHLWDDLHQEKSPLDDLRLEYILIKADPVHAILEVASKRSCDMIVMGSHGRTGLKRLLMGSIAEEIVRKAPCPVMVVKAPLPRGPGTQEPETGLNPNTLCETKG